MRLNIQRFDCPPPRSISKERSILEWKVNLPFMWIDAVATDLYEKENLLRDAVMRQDKMFCV